MDIYFWIISLLLPFMMVLFGYIFLYKAPKKVNYLYGFRTKWSMKSNETWAFAHKKAGVLFLSIGIIGAIVIVIDLLVLPVKIEILSVIHFIILFILLMGSVIDVELLLRKNFDKNGNKK